MSARTQAKPLRRVGVTTRRITDPKFSEIRDALSRDWSAYLVQTWPNIIPIPILNMADRVEDWAYELQLDAVILTNGNNWGEDLERDESESRLVGWCRENAVPVLGVCRGLQALNAMLGGRVEASTPDPSSMSHAGTCHEVSLVDQTIAEMAQADRISVNSYHDQCVTEQGLAAELVPFALAEDGVVEGFYHRTDPILAVQWHPERPGALASFDKKLIERLWADGLFWIRVGNKKNG
jgi:N5-(cytidine 5'-diphosphoramidyl)-L-glutamine hydrolase